MKTTPTRRKLIADAQAKHFTVVESETCVRISTGKTYRSLGVTIWPDGTATRNDIDFSQCLCIRTVKAMRELLGLA